MLLCGSSRRSGFPGHASATLYLRAGMPVLTIYEYYDSKEELAYVVPMETFTKFFLSARPHSPTKRPRANDCGCTCGSPPTSRGATPEWAWVLYLELWPSVLVTDKRRCVTTLMTMCG